MASRLSRGAVLDQRQYIITCVVGGDDVYGDKTSVPKQSVGDDDFDSFSSTTAIVVDAVGGFVLLACILLSFLRVGRHGRRRVQFKVGTVE